MVSRWRSLYPFESHFLSTPVAAENRCAESAGPNIHYVDEGRGEQTILCVHGNPTWSFYFRRIVSEFRNTSRVIAIDHIGCGLSDKPQSYPYTLAQHIENLSGLVEHLDLKRITLVVHDWGGAIGLGMGLNLCERIERLILLNTAAFPPPYIPWRIAACRIPVVGNFAMRGLNLFARAALRMALFRLKKLPGDAAAGLIAPYGSWADRVAIARFVQDIPSQPDQPTWQRLVAIENDLHKLAKRPAHIVWGMRDWCFRVECLEKLTRLLPNAHIRKLDDVGHYVMEEAPHEVCEAISQCMRQD